MSDDFDDDAGFDEADDELEFDCGMGRDGLCSMAGSEDCDFECPVMASIQSQRRKKARKA